jgi:hypothetical protein
MNALRQLAVDVGMAFNNLLLTLLVNTVVLSNVKQQHWLLYLHVGLCIRICAGTSNEGEMYRDRKIPSRHLVLSRHGTRFTGRDQALCLTSRLTAQGKAKGKTTTHTKVNPDFKLHSKF